MDRPILNLEMTTLREYSRVIAEKIKDKKIDVIVPILKGGVVLASMLGRDIGVSEFSCLHIKTTEADSRNVQSLEPTLLGITNENELENANILLVDDICDTGKSLNFAKKFLEKYNPQSITICVAINVNKQAKEEGELISAIDYSVQNYWIVFPWED